MRIEFIVTGKIKEKYLKEGIADYEGRLSHYFDFKITELTEQKVPEKYTEGEKAQLLAAEAVSIRKIIRPKSFVVIMAIEGKELSSVYYAKLIDTQMTNGISDIQIIIGSTLGVCESLKREADFLFSLGKATYPHQLMRLILLEQTYRAAKIIKNEKYHN